MQFEYSKDGGMTWELSSPDGVVTLVGNERSFIVHNVPASQQSPAPTSRCKTCGGSGVVTDRGGIVCCEICEGVGRVEQPSPARSDKEAERAKFEAAFPIPEGVERDRVNVDWYSSRYRAEDAIRYNVQWDAWQAQESAPSGESIDTPEFRAVLGEYRAGNIGDNMLISLIDARRATSERSEEKPAGTTLPSRLESWEKTVHVPQGGRAFRVPPEIAEEIERLRAELKIAGTTAAPIAGYVYGESFTPADQADDFMRGEGAPVRWAERATAGNAAPTDATSAAAPGDLPPNVETLRFLTDVVTAAGLLSYGKRDKGLAERISRRAFDLRTRLFADKAPGDLPPCTAPKGPFADYSAEEVEAFAREYGRACIASNAEAAIPEGFKLAPVKLTSAMAAALSDGTMGMGWMDYAQKKWGAMLAAAPSDTSPVGAKEKA